MLRRCSALSMIIRSGLFRCGNNIPQSLRVSNWGNDLYVSMLEAVVFWGEGVGLVDVAGAESLLEPSCALR